MKRFYQIPIVEEILLDKILEAPFCGASIGDYTGETGTFDDDSD